MKNGHSITVNDPTTGRALFASILSLGPDLVVAVGGGARPHVGCVVLATPVPSRSQPGTWTASCSVLTIPPHKEEPIARGVATRVASSCGRVTVVSAGVHDDGLDWSGIENYLKLSEELAAKVVEYLQSGDPE